MTLLDDLKELEAKASPGEWAYRSQELDDWGTIRTTETVGDWCPVVANARWNYTEDLPSHRLNKTDPAEPNGRFIVAATNLVRQSLRGEGDFIILPRVPSEEEVERCARITFAEMQAVVRDQQSHRDDIDFPSWEDDEETTRELTRRITRAVIAAYTGAHHE